jgi:hypothetical protein
MIQKSTESSDVPFPLKSPNILECMKFWLGVCECLMPVLSTCHQIELHCTLHYGLYILQQQMKPRHLMRLAI